MLFFRSKSKKEKDASASGQTLHGSNPTAQPITKTTKQVSSSPTETIVDSSLASKEEEEMKTTAQPLEKGAVKRTREDRDFLIDEEWLQETFKGVVDPEDSSDILLKLQKVTPRLKVGGLITLGRNEPKQHLMEQAGIPPLVRLAITDYAEERSATCTLRKLEKFRH